MSAASQYTYTENNCLLLVPPEYLTLEENIHTSTFGTEHQLFPHKTVFRRINAPA